MMNPQERELFRVAILTQLEASGIYHPTLGVLQAALRVAGHRQASPEELRAELLYLQDKSMVEPVGKRLSPENAKWRITAGGRDYLAEEGLA